ncbi:MAG: amidohydrolase/deacetylase family metallohydrolase [Acetobacteraceae bacterium]|nr:amidohydrolase/deacetylase family metallohydrolase [Acetobacteraceae bacterium]
MFDLVLRGRRVIDPAQGLDQVCDVAFFEGRVAAVEPRLSHGKETRDVSGLIVVPGLIDLHTHVYWGGTSLGVDPDAYAKSSGLTTLIDAGSAGPGNLRGFRRHVIERSEVRILPFLNISFAGIFALSADINVGECRDLALLNPRVCLAVAKSDADLVVGIKVRVGSNASGASGIAPMEMALEVAEHAGLPLMTHLDAPPPYRSDVLPRLRKGDILTHCFRPFPNTPVAPGGAVREDVVAARERGVIFDIGHGKGSFGFETAMAMLKNGFLPDVISSDVHAFSIDGPAYDLLTTMSKFLALGVPLQEVVRAATINPARAVRLGDRGTLRPGLLGDATMLMLEHGRFTFEDVVGERLLAEQKLSCRGIVLNGRWWHGQGNVT